MSERRPYQLVRHVSQEIYLLLARSAMGKQIVCQHFHHEVALLLGAVVFVHIDGCECRVTGDLAKGVFLCHKLIRFYDRGVQVFHDFLVFRRGFVQQYVLADFAVGQYAERAEHDEQIHCLTDARDHDFHRISIPVVATDDLNLYLLRRDTLVVWHGFDFSVPTTFRGVLAVVAIDHVLGRALLLENGFLRALDDEIAAVVKRAFVYGRRVDICVLVQDANGRIDHDGELPNTDFGDRLVDDSRLVHIQCVADGVFDVDVNGHIGRVCEVAQLRNVWEHDFVRAVVFVDVGLVNLQVGEGDFGFQQVLVQFSDEVFVGANHHGVEHINGLVELAIHAIVVGFQLVSYQHR